MSGLPYATQSSAGHQHASIMSRLEILYFQVQRSRGKVPGACIPWSTYQGDVAIRFSSARPSISHGLGIYLQTRVPPEYSVLCRRIAWLEVVSYIHTHTVRWVGLGLGTQDWRMSIPSLRHSRENGFAGWVEGLVNRRDDLVQHTSTSTHHHHQQQQCSLLLMLLLSLILLGFRANRPNLTTRCQKLNKCARTEMMRATLLNDFI